MFLAFFLKFKLAISSQIPSNMCASLQSLSNALKDFEKSARFCSFTDIIPNPCSFFGLLIIFSSIQFDSNKLLLITVLKFFNSLSPKSMQLLMYHNLEVTKLLITNAFPTNDRLGALGLPGLSGPFPTSIVAIGKVLN